MIVEGFIVLMVSILDYILQFLPIVDAFPSLLETAWSSFEQSLNGIIYMIPALKTIIQIVALYMFIASGYLLYRMYLFIVKLITNRG